MEQIMPGSSSLCRDGDQLLLYYRENQVSKYNRKSTVVGQLHMAFTYIRVVVEQASHTKPSSQALLKLKRLQLRPSVLSGDEDNYPSHDSHSEPACFTCGVASPEIAGMYVIDARPRNFESNEDAPVEIG